MKTISFDVYNSEFDKRDAEHYYVTFEILQDGTRALYDICRCYAQATNRFTGRPNMEVWRVKGRMKVPPIKSAELVKVFGTKYTREDK